MKIRRLFLIFLLLLTVVHFCFSQEKPKAFMIDEFGKPCSEDLMARLDAFFVGLQNDPSASGYIVFYGDKAIEGTNLNYIRYLIEVYPNRRFDKKRLFLLRGENQDEMKIQFWIVPAQANPPQIQNKFVSEKINSTTQFDKSWADFNKDNGKLDIYSNGFYDLGCDFSANQNAFAKTLLSNKELIGYLIIYMQSGKGKKYADRIAKFALNQLTTTYKVPRNRFQSIYGGNREEPEIEFWFVPKDGLLPRTMPAKK
jgi:hypothetical protein